ncbi:LysR family transcriptional regulator [Sphingomonas morindae]|uniref:LysR family transcriptional regulator n=1 Tax=Sphingomonas morindae TaxID=1541170 RepID=A0ABY4XBS8_9SPHN|nr:LysR substrate-binding domain-containing protein [Sphingomonas morindae]USI74425.1 LysR family transcriptional regulator [Sphingomonas morindae]
MMERYQLRYFLAVVDQGGFSRAAQHCHVTQPSLSAGIAKLERALGTALFLRSNQRVELTEAGARLLVHARRIEREFNAAQQGLTGAAGPVPLRLGVLRSLPVALIAPLAARLAEERLIELVEGSERELIGHVARGRVDCALTLVGRGGDRFVEQPLFEEGYALALPAGHRLAGADSVAAEALAGEVMLLRRHCEALAETSRHFTERGIRPHFAYRATEDERVLAMVAAGLGVTVMPESYGAPGVARPRLAGFTLRRTIGLLAAEEASAEARGAVAAALAAIRIG